MRSQENAQGGGWNDRTPDVIGGAGPKDDQSEDRQVEMLRLRACGLILDDARSGRLREALQQGVSQYLHRTGSEEESTGQGDGARTALEEEKDVVGGGGPKGKARPAHPRAELTPARAMTKKILQEFEREDDDMLTVREGDMVHCEEEHEGWIRARMVYSKSGEVGTGLDGWVPAWTTVPRIEPEDEGGSHERARYRSSSESSGTRVTSGVWRRNLPSR